MLIKKIVLPHSKEKQSNETKVKAICELREQYSLHDLLMISQLSKSSFFYGLKHLGYKFSKDVSLKPIIQHIFNKNHGKYGYIRMTYRLHQLGYRINRKRVYRLMKAMQLQATPKRHQYRSYCGTVGKIAPNLMNQSFETTGPYQKLGTDITQFRTKFGELYLSRIIELHNT